jgi:hypothetical protein
VSSAEESIVAHQFHPWGIRVADKVFRKVFLANRFEDAGVWVIFTGKNAKERYNVCMR